MTSPNPPHGERAPDPEPPGSPSPAPDAAPDESRGKIAAETIEDRRALWEIVGHIPPWSSGLLLLTWIALFGAMMARGEVGNTLALVRWGGSLVTTSGVELDWRLLAATLLHAGYAHLFFNGLSMAIFGPAVERVYGVSRFWILYGSAGLFSSWASAVWRASRLESLEVTQSVSVGASGAIFALGGAMLTASWKLRKRLPPGRARALAGSLLPLLLNGLVSGLTRSGTDNIGHLAGFSWGLWMGVFLGLNEPLSERPTGTAIQLLGILAAGAMGLALVYSVLHGLGYLH